MTQLTGGLRYGDDPSTRMAVNDGDVLDGTGTVNGGLKVKSGGTVYPGINGVGSLTVEGKGRFEAGSNWKVKLGTANAGDSNRDNRTSLQRRPHAGGRDEHAHRRERPDVQSRADV